MACTISVLVLNKTMPVIDEQSKFSWPRDVLISRTFVDLFYAHVALQIYPNFDTILVFKSKCIC